MSIRSNILASKIYDAVIKFFSGDSVPESARMNDEMTEAELHEKVSAIGTFDQMVGDRFKEFEQKIQALNDRMTEMQTAHDALESQLNDKVATISQLTESVKAKEVELEKATTEIGALSKQNEALLFKSTQVTPPQAPHAGVAPATAQNTGMRVVTFKNNI